MGIQSQEYHRAWRERNKDRVHAYYLRYYAMSKEALRLKRQSVSYRKKLSDYLRKWRTEHVAKIKEAMREWTSKNKAHIAAYKKKHAARRRELYRGDKERICARKKELLKTPKYRSVTNARNRRRRASDIQFSLKDRLRASMNRAFRRNWMRKPARTEALLGCSIAKAREHIEKQFGSLMSWENRQSWHIDHFVPIVAFDLTDPEEALLAFNWKNLRPVMARANFEKSDKLPNPLPDWLPEHVRERIEKAGRGTLPA